VSGTGTTTHCVWSNRMLGGISSGTRLCITHLQASLRRGFFCTEIESAAWRLTAYFIRTGNLAVLARLRHSRACCRYSETLLIPPSGSLSRRNASMRRTFQARGGGHSTSAPFGQGWPHSHSPPVTSCNSETPTENETDGRLTSSRIFGLSCHSLRGTATIPWMILFLRGKSCRHDR